MLKVLARRTPWGDDVELMFVEHLDGGGRAVADPLTLRTITPDTLARGHQPTASLENTAAQHLMDELWACGLRPSEGTGSAGSLAATQRHLQDMRAIAANALHVELPK
jgi:hypothetical protein